MTAALLEELALLWPRELERLDMIGNEKDLVFWKEKALKNALKTEENWKKWKGTNEGFENHLEYVTKAKEVYASSL